MDEFEEEIASMARVQIVDDEPAVLALIKASLEKDEHEISAFQNPVLANCIKSCKAGKVRKSAHKCVKD